MIIRSQKAEELVYVWKNEGIGDGEIKRRLEFYHFDIRQKDITTIPYVYGAEAGMKFKRIKNLNL